MKYLTGVTNDRDEAEIIRYGIGLMIQPGNSYHLRVDRYPFYAADNGCFNPDTYKGDDAWLDWLDALPRERCLFAVVPDVARRPDGSLGGDPVATWDKFLALSPIVQAMGFPAALAAQDGIENMPNVNLQLALCDALFLAGSTEWKVGPEAEKLAHLARSMGKWVHMGRVNSLKRMKRAREMGCNSADGTFLKYRRRKNGHGILDARGAGEIGGWLVWLDANPPLFNDETPSLPVHKDAIAQAPDFAGRSTADSTVGRTDR